MQELNSYTQFPFSEGLFSTTSTVCANSVPSFYNVIRNTLLPTKEVKKEKNLCLCSECLWK